MEKFQIEYECHESSERARLISSIKIEDSQKNAKNLNFRKWKQWKRKPRKIVIHFDHTKIVKIIVKKPCRDGIFSTKLTGNSANMPGQPIQC